MHKHQQQGRQAVPLLFVETSSSYVSIAPALRSVQTMARSGIQLPLAKYLLPAVASTLEEDGAAERTPVLPHYIQAKRYVISGDIGGLADGGHKIACSRSMFSNKFLILLIKLMFVLFICFQALESVLLSVAIRSCRWRGLGGAPWSRHAPAGDLSHGGPSPRDNA